MEDFRKKSHRLQLVVDLTNHFWVRWAQEVTPADVIQRKWHETGRYLRVGDLVLVHDSNKVKNKYVLAKVETVKESGNGLVRSCSVGYSNTRATKDPRKYQGHWVTLHRSVQRLTLLLPVEEQDEDIVVSDNGVHSAVRMDQTDKQGDGVTTHKGSPGERCGELENKGLSSYESVPVSLDDGGVVEDASSGSSVKNEDVLKEATETKKEFTESILSPTAQSSFQME